MNALGGKMYTVIVRDNRTDTLFEKQVQEYTPEQAKERAVCSLMIVLDYLPNDACTLQVISCQERTWDEAMQDRAEPYVETPVADMEPVTEDLDSSGSS